MNMVRLLFWICLAIVWIGSCNCGWIFFRALQPEQGARMYLMLSGCIFPPMICAAVFAIGLVLGDGKSFQRWEWALAWLAGLLALGIGGAAFVIV